jgi:putative DNA methylase
VKSRNPAFAQGDVPLASTFMLSTKAGKEAYVEPAIGEAGYQFTVKVGKPKEAEAAEHGTKLARGANFRCLMSGSPIPGDYIKAEGQAGRMGARLMALVAEGERGRVHLPPTPEHEAIAPKAKPTWKPTGEVPARLTGGTCVPYGMNEWGDLFPLRQLVALTTFSDLAQEAREQVKRDALAAGLPDDGRGLDAGGTGAQAYAEGVGAELAIATDKAADYWSTICFWHSAADQQKIVNTFSRQAIPMSWDYAEGNPFSVSSGHFLRFVSLISEMLDFSVPADPPSWITQEDAAHTAGPIPRFVARADPPYFNNIGYADLSDFFFTWGCGVRYRPFSPDFSRR